MSNRIKDRTGQRVGKLVAVRATEKRIRKSVVWEFKCDCGNTVERLGSDVFRNAVNSSTSCGCTRPREIDLTNKKIGMLTAVKRLDKDKRGYKWEFLCDCGNSCIKNGAQVNRREGALHCGCVELRGGNNKNDLTGEIFGELTVLEFAGTTKAKQSRWLCECSCGNHIEISGYYLRRGKSDCGCKKAKGEENHSFKGYKEIYGSYWTSLKRGAELRDLDFEITIEFAWELFEKQKSKCALSGVEIFLGQAKHKTASLDRINPKKGYVKNNVQWVHKTVNTAKMGLQNEEYIEWCRRVANNWA